MESIEQLKKKKWAKSSWGSSLVRRPYAHQSLMNVYIMRAHVRNYIPPIGAATRILFLSDCRIVGQSGDKSAVRASYHTEQFRSAQAEIAFRPHREPLGSPHR